VPLEFVLKDEYFFGLVGLALVFLGEIPEVFDEHLGSVVEVYELAGLQMLVHLFELELRVPVDELLVGFVDDDLRKPEPRARALEEVELLSLLNLAYFTHFTLLQVHALRQLDLLLEEVVVLVLHFGVVGVVVILLDLQVVKLVFRDAHFFLNDPILAELEPQNLELERLLVFLFFAHLFLQLCQKVLRVLLPQSLFRAQLGVQADVVVLQLVHEPFGYFDRRHLSLHKPAIFNLQVRVVETHVLEFDQIGRHKCRRKALHYSLDQTKGNTCLAVEHYVLQLVSQLIRLKSNGLEKIEYLQFLDVANLENQMRNPAVFAQKNLRIYLRRYNHVYAFLPQIIQYLYRFVRSQINCPLAHCRWQNAHDFTVYIFRIRLV